MEEGEIQEGQLFDELVIDYGKEPTEEVNEIMENPQMYIRSYWLTHQDTFFRVSCVFFAMSLLFFILL